MLNVPVGGNLIPCVPDSQISSFLGMWSVQITSCSHSRTSEDNLSNVFIRECFTVSNSFVILCLSELACINYNVIH